MNSSAGDLHYDETRAIAQVVELLDRPACLLADNLSILHCNASSRNARIVSGLGSSTAMPFDQYCQRQLASAIPSISGSTTTGEVVLKDAPALTCLRLGELYLCLGEPDEAVEGQVELYRSLVEQQCELICRVDVSGHVTFANHALCRYLKCELDQLCQQRLHDIVMPDSVADLDHILAAESSLAEDAVLELKILGDAAEPRCTRWSVRLLTTADNLTPGLQLTGRDVTDQQVYYEELLEYQQQLRSLAAGLITTEEYERHRIADGMSEQVSRKLAEVNLRLTTALDQTDPSKLSALIADTIDLVAKIQDSVNDLTFELSPPILYDMGFIAALEWLAGHITTRYGVVVKFIDDGLPKQMNNELRILLYHSARELLINVVQHARTSNAELRLARNGDSIELTVEDPGCGFDLAARDKSDCQHYGFGHFTITERLHHLGGQTEIKSSPGCGTRVILRAPLVAETTTPRPQAPPPIHPGRRRRPEVHPEVRVLLADEHEVLRDGLKTTLSDYAGIEVVADAGNGEQAVELALRHCPDVVILDVCLPGLDGIETTRRILAERPDTRVIALSSHSDHHWMRGILKAGAVGYLLKDTEPRDLVQAIRSARSALRCFSQLAFKTVIADFIRYDELDPSGKQALLSRRERQVLELIADGLATKEIAQRLDLSVKTIETYRRRMLDKLNLDSIAGLTKYAIQEGMTDINSRH